MSTLEMMERRTLLVGKPTVRFVNFVILPKITKYVSIYGVVSFISEDGFQASGAHLLTK